MQSFSNPDFTSPGSVTDCFAVVSLSVALGLLPVGVAILLRGSRLGTWPVRSLGLASVVSAGTAAVANIVEDGLGASWAGTAYFAGVVGTLLVLLVVAAALAVKGPRLLALVPIATVVGMVNLERAGGLIVLIAWGGLAGAVAHGVKLHLGQALGNGVVQGEVGFEQSGQDHVDHFKQMAKTVTFGSASPPT